MAFQCFRARNPRSRRIHLQEKISYWVFIVTVYWFLRLMFLPVEFIGWILEKRRVHKSVIKTDGDEFNADNSNGTGDQPPTLRRDVSDSLQSVPSVQCFFFSIDRLRYFHFSNNLDSERLTVNFVNFCHLSTETVF